jgi:hypothetical protein
MPTGAFRKMNQGESRNITHFMLCTNNRESIQKRKNQEYPMRHPVIRMEMERKDLQLKICISSSGFSQNDNPI